jgi:hypothetical protein
MFDYGMRDDVAHPTRFYISSPAGGNKLKKRCSRFILSLRTKYSLILRAAQQQAFSIRSRDAKFLSRFFNT